MMKVSVILTVSLILRFVSGFVTPEVKSLAFPENQLRATVVAPLLISKKIIGNDGVPLMLRSKADGTLTQDPQQSNPLETLIPVITLFAAPLPAAAAGGAVLSALWAYAHSLSILVIVGCLAAERTMIKAGMTVEEEHTVVKLDLVYGIMAVLLITSGFFRATDYGKGSDFYLHETLFWVKMTFSGIWGGMSLFPSITFYKRSWARKDDETVPPVSEKLAERLTQAITAELSAVLSIPFVATLMARGVWYWQDFPWPLGLVVAILATAGSFYLYAREALTWTEDEAERLDAHTKWKRVAGL